jgi:ABC-type bacteriocin/lantibiotic exporter with double-glycine peptidase domain
VLFNASRKTLNLIMNRLVVIILISLILETAAVVILEKISSKLFLIWVTQICLGKIKHLTRKLFCYMPRLTGII